MNNHFTFTDAKPIFFFDIEKSLTLKYPVPLITEKCPECGDFEWLYSDHDWEDGKSDRKWISLKCQGRKFIVLAYKLHGLPDGYYEKCEFVIRIPLDETTRIIEGGLES